MAFDTRPVRDLDEFGAALFGIGHLVLRRDLPRARWWEDREIYDPDDRREGAGAQALGRVRTRRLARGLRRLPPQAWLGARLDGGELRVVEAIGATPRALRGLWGYLLAIDWIATVRAWLLPPDHPPFLMLASPRRTRFRMGDAVCVRLVDVGAALSARSYSDEGSIVFEVADEFCASNDGRWKLEGGEAARTDEEADLSLPVQSLGSAYLGASPSPSWRAPGEWRS
jgi:hypothetical protein